MLIVSSIIVIVVIALAVAFVAFTVTRKTPGYNPETSRVEIDGERAKVTAVHTEFMTLLVYGKIISIFGWVVVLLCLVGILGGISSGEDEGFFLAGGAFIALILGFGMVAFGQLISCFVSIEKNTRTTFEILKKN